MQKRCIYATERAYRREKCRNGPVLMQNLLDSVVALYYNENEPVSGSTSKRPRRQIP